MTTFKKSSFKRLGALVMAMAMVCAMAISASAVSEDGAYKASFSGMPASHNDAIFDSVRVVDEETLEIQLKNPIVISSQQGEITAVTGDGVSYNPTSHVITVSCDPEDESLSIPVSVTIVMTVGEHKAGRIVDSTLEIAPVV